MKEICSDYKIRENQEDGNSEMKITEHALGEKICTDERFSPGSNAHTQ